MNTTQNLESQPIQTRKAYYSLQDEIDALRQSARQHEGAESYHDLMNLIEVNNQIIRAKAYKASVGVARNAFCDTEEFNIAFKSKHHLVAATSQTRIEIISIAMH